MCLTQEKLLSRNRKAPWVSFFSAFSSFCSLFLTFILALPRKSGNVVSILQSILHYRGKPTIMDWICVSSQNPNIKAPLPNVMVLGGTLVLGGRCLGYVVGALMNRLGDFIRRDMREMPSFPTICKSGRESLSDTGSVITLILDFLASKTARHKDFLTYLLCDHLL